MKLRDALNQDLQNAQMRLDYVRAQLCNVMQSVPQLLNMDLGGRIYVMDEGHWLNYQALDVDEARHIAITIMDLLGIDSASKVDILSKQYTIRIETGNVCIDIDIPKQDCHKAIVTKTETIEFCGKLDESKYDKVEYL